MIHYLVFYYLMLYYLNVRSFDNAQVAVLLVPVTLVAVSRFNVAVF